MFGASNQLVAALAMIVVTVYLVERSVPRSSRFIPAVFMLITTCGALVWQGYGFLTAKEPNYILALRRDPIAVACGLSWVSRGFFDHARGRKDQASESVIDHEGSEGLFLELYSPKPAGPTDLPVTARRLGHGGSAVSAGSGRRRCTPGCLMPS